MPGGLVVLLAGLALQAGGPEPGAPGVRLTHLELDVRVHYHDGTIDGIARLTLENPGPRPVGDVPLQVHRLMEVEAAHSADGRPLTIEQDVVRYVDSPRRQVTQAVVRLPAPLGPGETTQIAVRWSGFLWGYTETGSRYIRDRVDSAFTILRNDALAFPALRVPSWRANRAAPRGDFTFVARITVPRGQSVAAGGALVERIEGDSLVTWVYRSTLPVPFLNIAIAPYRQLSAAGITIHHFPEDSAGAGAILEAVTRAAERLTAWFGPLGRELRLTVMEIPEGYGSQANLGAGIIQDARAFRARDEMGQLYHELTHLWNAPDTDAPSPRWNEGLATFLQYRLTEALDGWTGMDAYVQRVVDWFLPRFAADSANLTTPFIDYGRTGKTDLSYTVGLFFFYELFEVLGEEAFDRAVGSWYQERRERGGTTDEFLAHLRRSAGVPLDALFDDWMYTTRWYDRLRAGETLRQLADAYGT